MINVLLSDHAIPSIEGVVYCDNSPLSLDEAWSVLVREVYVLEKDLPELKGSRKI